MTLFELRELGTIMEPLPGNPLEAEGVLNPAAARGPDGALYLFPRLVAARNYSRIGIAKVIFNQAGDPVGVERLGIALQPQEPYELRSPRTGGCEDPRVTFMGSLQRYVMTYVALSRAGPRVAMAISADLMNWRRMGLTDFEPYHGIDFEDIDDKDATLFPDPLVDPSGGLKFALLHRPHFTGKGPGDTGSMTMSRAADLDRKSIWISYSDVKETVAEPSDLGTFNSHLPLASPEAQWDHIKIGAGTPPILTRHGWLLIYHGVTKRAASHGALNEFRYSAGLMILDKVDPRIVIYRSAEPLFTLGQSDETTGSKSDVVFPTGIDRRDDLGMPDRFDIYYGMGDTRIGAVTLTLPEALS